MMEAYWVESYTSGKDSNIQQYAKVYQYCRLGVANILWTMPNPVSVIYILLGFPFLVMTMLLIYVQSELRSTVNCYQGKVVFGGS